MAAAILPSNAWEIDKMNEQIEKTNVIVSGICSGTVIDKKKRLVLTAHHCITDNLKETVKKEVDPISGEIKEKKIVERKPLYIEVWHRQDFEVVSSEMHTAEIRGYDDKTDVAVIQVIGEDWNPEMAAPFASDDYKYKRGLTVFAVGNPGILFDNSITQGIISAPERALSFGTGNIKMFQHSASIIGGSSGGAIYNDKGEIIGTVTGGVRGADIGLSVPIRYTKELLKRLNIKLGE
jgi:S1-C subfamily serine protease